MATLIRLTWLLSGSSLLPLVLKSNKQSASKSCSKSWDHASSNLSYNSCKILMKSCKMHNVCSNQDVSEYPPKTSLFPKKMHETTLKTVKKRSVKLAKMLWHHNTKLKACLSLSKYWNIRMMNERTRETSPYYRSQVFGLWGFMHSNLGSFLAFRPLSCPKTLTLIASHETFIHWSFCCYFRAYFCS